MGPVKTTKDGVKTPSFLMLEKHYLKYYFFNPWLLGIGKQHLLQAHPPVKTFLFYHSLA
jgi:hypothetical protein